jgi:SAM-dependent methyltransferase
MQESMTIIEKIKQYWDSRPCNIKHSPKPIGTKEYFDEVEQRKYFVEPHIPGFAQFERWRGKKVLEIGCGIGTDAVNFARAGADYTCVELSEKSLELCKKRFEIYGLKGRFYLGSSEELSKFLPQEKYDLIYSFGVIHHTPNPERAIEEIKKYCNSDTEVRLMLYSKWSWKVFWIILKYGKGMFWKAGELIPKYSEAQIGSPVTHVYSFNDVRKLLHGFEILEMRKEHIFPYEIEAYKRYEYKKVWYFRWMPHPFFRWLERRLGWHTLIVAKLR